MKYRPEIDGLRALAVLPVLFFHAGFAWFPGGFVGVDVFFVISGYLITSILRDDIAAGRFSVLGFYERRVRRIMPALAVMCLATIPVAWAWLPPREFDFYGQTLATANLSVSNFLFWKRSDYFAPAAEFEPLLHTWSLGVEEQFYLLFPFLFLLLARGRRMLAVVALLCLASFAATQVFASVSPAANFYLLPSRFWELGAGALLALAASDTRERPWTLAGELLSLAGLALIVASILFLDGARPFPGWWALPVVGGTVLVLAFGRAGTWTARLLGFRPLVWVGLISYSAYLWHQPLLAFARVRLDGQVPQPLLLALIAATLLIAYASWRWVELPFRNRARFSRNQIFAGATVVGLALLAFGAVADRGGMPFRHPDPAFASSIQERMRHNTGLGDACVGRLPLAPQCETSAVPEVLVWGDSFAMHMVPAVIASKPDVGLVQFTKPVCGPFLDLAPTFLPDYPPSWAEECHAFTQAVKAYVTSTKSLKYAVLASPFGQYFGPDIQLLSDGKFVPTDDALVLSQLKRTLDWLIAQGIKPVIIAPTPQDGRDTARCVVRARWYGDDPQDCRISRAAADAFRPDVRALLDAIAKDYTVLDPAEILCDGSWCKVADGDVVIYRDNGHFSYEGAAYVGQKMRLYDRLTGLAR